MARQIIPIDKVVSGSGSSTLFSFAHTSGTSTFAELSNNQLNNDRTITLYYDVYKKIKTS